jgi:hypothetical protein
MSVAGPLHRFTVDKRGRALDLLRETLVRIGTTLGYSVIPRQFSGVESMNGYVKEGGAQGSSQMAALESE